MNPLVRFFLALAVLPLGGVAADAPSREITLTALVLLPDARLLEAAEFRGVAGIDASRLGPWNDLQWLGLGTSFLGRPITQPLFEELRATLSRFMRERFGVLALVQLPPQEATAGVLQVVVTPGRIAALEVTGARWFPIARYRAGLRAQAGDVLNLRDLRADVEQLNASPYRHAELLLAPGAAQGTTGVTLEVRDRLPLRLFTGYNDTGTRSTSRERISAGIEWGNAFGRDDTLSYQYSGDPQLMRLRSHAVSYRAHLPAGHALTVSASSARIDAAIAEPFDQRGASSALGLRYDLPLAPWRGLPQSLSFAADYKRSDNNLLFATIPITDNLTDIVQGSVTYAISRPGARGSTDLALSIVASPGGLTARNHTRFFRDSRAAARADYLYGTIDLGRTQRLPHDFTWRATLRGQLSSGNLLGSEQLGVGGVGSVRGYDDGAIYGDEGVLVSNELRLPPLRALGRLSERLADSLQPLAFVDYGWAHVHTPLADEQANFQLASIGAGLRYQLRQYLTASADYGWQLRTVSAGTARARRAHVNVSLSW